MGYRNTDHIRHTTEGKMSDECNIQCSAHQDLIFYEVWGKVIFLHLFVILFTGEGGIPACIAGDIPACLAAWEGCAIQGVPGRGGLLGRGLVGGCLVMGGLLPGGCLVGGGSAPRWGAWWRPPGRQLLWAVRIQLECILVLGMVALVDDGADVEGYRVLPIGSFKQHIYSVLIGQFSGLPLSTDGQEVPSSINRFPHFF